MKAPRRNLSVFLILFLSCVVGCSKRIPEGFGLAYEELERHLRSTQLVCDPLLSKFGLKYRKFLLEGLSES